MVGASRRAVFLDRDGVINRCDVVNRKPYAPRSLEAFEFLPGVHEAADRLKKAGYLLFVVTNQPDIANGITSATTVERMHARITAELPITKIFMCPHGQKDGCACRKPKPGLLLAAQAEFGIDMAHSFMIGDRHCDVQAALAAGCIPVFIDYDYVETPVFDVSMRAGSLAEASLYILGKQKHD